MLALKVRRFETWAEVYEAVQQAIVYWMPIVIPVSGGDVATIHLVTVLGLGDLLKQHELRGCTTQVMSTGSSQMVATTPPRGASVRPGQTYIGLALVVLALTSCASWQAQYLKAAANHATLAEVEQHLGRPHSTWTLHTGETLWTYQSGLPSATNTGGITIVGPGWVIGRRSDCTEYVLLFDPQQILRAWMRQPCRPAHATVWNGA